MKVSVLSLLAGPEDEKELHEESDVDLSTLRMVIKNKTVHQHLQVSKESKNEDTSVCLRLIVTDGFGAPSSLLCGDIQEELQDITQKEVNVQQAIFSRGQCVVIESETPSKNFTFSSFLMLFSFCCLSKDAATFGNLCGVVSKTRPKVHRHFVKSR